MKLVIVESPTKAKTLTRFLEGQGYDVEATYGHIRDLPVKKLGVNVDKNFQPEYVIGDKQKERVAILKKAADMASEIYLATDPDREGEAIAWHVAEVVRGDKSKNLKRVVFHEITKQAIDEAMRSPRHVDMKLVDAQQARRVLDRLVGYKLSPLLWKKVRKGLSAGRVQSAAVRLTVEREREIEAFVPEEYWNIWAVVAKESGEGFRVKLIERDGEKFKVGDAEVAKKTESDLKDADYKVAEVVRKDFTRIPPAPFTTSTLQQTAANRLGWSAKRTMQIAQSLYEEGYITYHRTDSTNLATEAVVAARGFIARNWGKEFALETPRFYKTKSKVAQEAHEAIRPTEVGASYSVLSTQLGRDAVKLYELIWKRFVACQMAEAKGVMVTVTVSGKAGVTVYGLQAKGETIKFLGWLKLYEKEPSDTENADEKQENVVLPEVYEGDRLKLESVVKEQKFTQPPARYNDAGLIKALEELGIGRPSTYAPILSTIQTRMYVEKMEKRFKPTALGTAVNDFLVKYFQKIVDYQFTAQMEDQLDEVANGQREWQPMISQFYGPLEKEIEEVERTGERVKVQVESTGEKCPKCGQGEVVIREGKFGKFLSCGRFPECDYRATYVNKAGIPCPKCGGDVVVKRTKSGKTFYGCANYPKCDFASWTRPSHKAAEGSA